MSLHRHNRAKTIRSGREPRGSMLLASLMTISFGTLVLLGMVTTMLTERVRTEQTVGASRAASIAHSGVEYALWEINYGGNDFQFPEWKDSTAAACTAATEPCHYQQTLSGGTVDVTVDKTTGTDWTIISRGTSEEILRKITVTVSAGSALPDPETFDNQILYAELGYIHLDARGGEILLDGYNSNNGAYDPTNPLPPGSIEIITDKVPFRHMDWNQLSHVGLSDDAPAILEGNVTAKVNIRIRTPDASELPVVSPMTYVSEVTGLADKTNDTTGPGGLPDGIPDGFKGQIIQEARTTSLGFQAQTKVAPPAVQITDPAAADIIHPDLYFDPGSGFDPAAGDVMMICPGESVQSTEVTVEDATLVIGCSSDPASPYYCNRSFPPGQERFKDFYGATKSCAGSTPSAKVTIGTKPTSDVFYPDQGQYALWVRGTGQILVLSPMEIYYDNKGAQGGFNLGGGGIRNQYKRANGAVDPNAVAIFGGKDQAVSTNYISTSEPFHGKIFNPYADVTFTNTGPLDFHGAINGRGITTSSTVKIHWDESFKYPSGGGGGGGSTCTPELSNCRPQAGSWSISNY